MSTVPVDFELLINEMSGNDRVELEGNLRSPSLDPAMHPKGEVTVSIATKGKTIERKSEFLLDSFQFRSLLDYLCLQNYVRQILEQELPRDQEAVDPQGDPVVGDVWSWARVRSLQLRLRDVRTPEAIDQLKNLGYSPSEIEDLIDKPESPETRSFFIVTVDCDWDQDHVLAAKFRDGQFVCLEPYG